MKYLLLVLLFTYGSMCQAQKEGNNWYFGYSYSLDFNSGKPVTVKRSTMQTRFGCGSISNAKGRTLFYSDGLNIYDSSHSAIPNAIFKAYYLSSQPALFVPWPDSSHLYFLFTSYVNNDSCLKYSIVNFKLRKGLGDIEKGKLNIKLPSYALGKINAVRHANRHDYWVMVPQLATDSVYTYLITNKGIQLPPIRSKIGIVFKTTNSGSNQYLGYLKFSPDGKKVGHVSIQDSSFIADFDASTGKVNNPWWFYSRGALSFEYSNTSRYLYLCQYANKVVQFDLESKTINEFIASNKTIDSGAAESYTYGVMQLASDGKIYIFPDPRFPYNPPNYAFLNVIHSPDSIGKKARVERNFISLGYFSSTGSVGLPDMVQSFFHKPNFGVRQNCANDTVFFNIKDTYELDSVRWHFGDTARGASNLSTQTKNVFHHYKKLGTYKVRLISFHRTYTDTIYETFLLKQLKPFIGKDTNFCKSKFLSLSPSEEYAGYKWSNSQTVKSIYITNPGTYILTVSDYGGCKGSDTIKISKPMVKADFTVNDENQCFKGNDFKLKENTNYSGGLRQNALWLFNDSLISNDSLINISFNNVGDFSIKLISESYGACRDSITKTLSVYSNSKVGFSINNPIQCFNTHGFNFKINKDTGNINYAWDLGDKSITVGNDINDKRYLKDTSYNIRLIATTDNNCKDTLIKSIIILPSPIANFSWDLACSRTITKFQYTGSKPIQSFLWDFNNDATSTFENPTYKFASTGSVNTTLILVSPNGCKDSLAKSINIKPQSKADFITDDICETDSAIFINKSQDATSYNWRFGDGLKSSKESPKHLYSFGGVSRTFNVLLVAIVTDGCSDSITKAISINSNPKSDYSYTKSGKTYNFTPAQSDNSKYRWLFGDGDSSLIATANHTYTDALREHTVCLKTTNAAGCISETCNLVSTAGVFIISDHSGFKLYPNPNTGKFTIEIENQGKETTIEVYNALGKLIEKIQTEEKITNFELINLSGIYIIRVKYGINTYTQKMVISR